MRIIETNFPELIDAALRRYTGEPCIIIAIAAFIEHVPHITGPARQELLATLNNAVTEVRVEHDVHALAAARSLTRDTRAVEQRWNVNHAEIMHATPHHAPSLVAGFIETIEELVVLKEIFTDDVFAALADIAGDLSPLSEPDRWILFNGIAAEARRRKLLGEKANAVVVAAAARQLPRDPRDPDSAKRDALKICGAFDVHLSEGRAVFRTLYPRRSTMPQTAEEIPTE